MDMFHITGGIPLSGEVSISGAKNAALPILAASLLLSEQVIIHNVPYLRDIKTMLALLVSMGARASREDETIIIDAGQINHCVAPYHLVSVMRASILVLGPLLTRFGYAEVSMPGGCAIGARPVNLHLQALEAMGATVVLEKGYIKASTPGHLTGCDFTFDTVTVTGTENILMAAVLARGTTTLRNASREPEVSDLAQFLNKMGAKITGMGTSVLTIEGVDRLQGCDYRVLPDRIEAGTYLAAAAITRGAVRVSGIAPALLSSTLTKFEEAGAVLIKDTQGVTLDMHGKRAKAVSFETGPFPDFCTDMQAQMMALNTVAAGEGKIVETIFENRFMHAQELLRMGANIQLQGNTAVTRGVAQLHAAPVMATDLRASASLVLAGLAAEGETVVKRVYHIDRGYSAIENKLRSLGAKIERSKESRIKVDNVD